MALARRGRVGESAHIWPGFVDALGVLVLVLTFVLSIFMIVQFMLRETITGQATELGELTQQVNDLATALGLEKRHGQELETQIGGLTATLDEAAQEADRQQALIAALTKQTQDQAAALTDAQGRITSFEAQVSGLLAERDKALAEGQALGAERDKLVSDKEALNLALAQARTEIDTAAEEARLAAARREALDAMVADLKRQVGEGQASLADLAAQLKDTEGKLEGAEAARTDLADQLDDAEKARLAEAAAAEALRQRLEGAQAQLSDAEKAKLAEAAAAEALRARLKDADAELTAMTLALEEQRKKAEETLTLLAAARAGSDDLTKKLSAQLAELAARDAALKAAQEDQADQGQALAKAQQDLAAAQAELAAVKSQVGSEAELQQKLADAIAARTLAEDAARTQMTEAERTAALLSQARTELGEKDAKSTEDARRIEVLNQQMAELRKQVSTLQGVIGEAEARDATKDVQVQNLGKDLNSALARAALAEQKQRIAAEALRAKEEELRKKEEAENARLAAENKDLSRYRSEFFGKLSQVLTGRDGVRVVGDRFVFSSEVLFEVGAATLSPEGEAQIAKVAQILNEVRGDIPDDVNWIIRVDGHTDNTPYVGVFGDNWGLSQARALSVVHYLVDSLGFPPERLAATGFGEFQPVAPEDTPEGRAANRRIELKLTER